MDIPTKFNAKMQFLAHLNLLKENLFVENKSPSSVCQAAPGPAASSLAITLAISAPGECGLIFPAVAAIFASFILQLNFSFIDAI